MTTLHRVWLITGSSSGFGRAIAEAALLNGDSAVLTAMAPERLGDLVRAHPGRALAVEMDVTRRDQVSEAVARGIETFGHVDVVVNNAGFGLLGAVEEVDDSQVREVFETNFFGVLAVIRGVLPHMRAAGRGHIINFSSQSGFRGVGGFAAYCASKFAVEGLSEALAEELTPLGIKVTIVEPGRFRTNWGRSLRMAPNVLNAYSQTAGAMRGIYASIEGQQRGDPARAAQAILRAVAHERPPLRLILGPDALTTVRRKLAAVLEESTNWEEISRSTDFADYVTS